MAHTVQRLTLYALISALERDLRDFLSLHVGPSTTPETLLSKPVRDKAQERYEKENSESEPADIDELLDYLDLGEEIYAIRAHEKALDGVTRAYIKKYYLGLEGIIPIRNRVMHSRPLEYDDLARVSSLAAELVKSHRSLWANLRTARKELDRDPDTFAGISIPDTIDESTNVLHNLPHADFDDTGFVARERELNELKRALAGSYPVVTVVGEGGLGKTSLALKACYDLLDDAESGLDAIVWTTAKATKLTLSEIEVIEGAISTSLGIIESANSLLGRQDESAAIDDLLAHLTNNKILLVIDNLETVIDQNIRALVKQVPQGSKILFTTRVGLGAFDFPIPLSPLDAKSSAFYFRRTARVWGVPDMATATNAVVDGYCEKLQHNPLFIKWFIQSVRAGKRPTVLTSDPKVLLQFCLQNVFNTLSGDAKRVARTLASVSGSQTVASLAFFTELDSIGIQSALSVLITSNLVSAERGRSSEDEDRYTLSTLSRLYIQRLIRPEIEEQKRLIRKQNELRSAQEEFSARTGADLFDMKNVFVREKDDYIVAKILTKAIESVFSKDLTKADAGLAKAADLSPNYFESHRVRAMLLDAGDDVLGAEAAYETAISLAPERAPLRLWFGQFLSKKIGDQERALKQLLKAEELAPQSAYVKIECARVLQYHRQFDAAQERLSQVENIEKLPARARRVHLDLSLQNLLRRAEHESSIEQYNLALDDFEKARVLISSAPVILIDHVTLRHIARAKRHFLSLKRVFKGCPEETRVNAIEDWLAEPLNIKVEKSALDLVNPDAAGVRENAPNLPPNRGRLTSIHQNYAFIDTGGARFFFHRGCWGGLLDFTALKDGAIVEFEIGPENERGPTANRVRPIEDMPENPNQRELIRGSIKSLSKSSGFIRIDSGGDIFFHRTHCTAATRFRALIVGERVRFIRTQHPDGRVSAINVECYSGL